MIIILYFFLLVAILLFIHLAVSRKVWTFYFALPVFIGLTIYAYYVYVDQLGYAVAFEDIDFDKAMYLGSFVAAGSQYILILERGTERGPRLVALDAESKKQKEMVEGAEGELQKGKGVRISKLKDTEVRIEAFEFHQLLPPKED